MGRAVTSSSMEKSWEVDDCRHCGGGSGALAAVLERERLLVDELVVVSVVLLERRRVKGLRASKEAIELKRCNDFRLESEPASLDSLLRNGISFTVLYCGQAVDRKGKLKECAVGRRGREVEMSTSGSTYRLPRLPHRKRKARPPSSPTRTFHVLFRSRHLHQGPSLGTTSIAVYM